jgi:16S rRNA processing protein RimM
MLNDMSNDNNQPTRIKIGVVSKPYGLEGAFLVNDVQEKPRSLQQGAFVLLGYSEKFAKKYTVEFSQCTFNKYILRLKEFSTPESIEQIKEFGIFASVSDLMRNSAEDYFEHELAGCAVYTMHNNVKIGTFSHSETYPSNEIWYIENEKYFLPIPAVPSIVKKVDIAKKRIYITLIPGLMDLKEPK